MKIAVLFGSFNPMTNAHVAAMKAAVAHLDADKGLFVATNGQYLKRKTVKISDPFYLSEEERKEVIEKVCEAEEKLDFWGYELGGINPSRFKTLCKIKKQYPDTVLVMVLQASIFQFACQVTKIEPRNIPHEDFAATIRRLRKN